MSRWILCSLVAALVMFAIPTTVGTHGECHPPITASNPQVAQFYPAASEIWEETNSMPGLQRNGGCGIPPDTCVIKMIGGGCIQDYLASK